MPKTIDPKTAAKIARLAEEGAELTRQYDRCVADAVRRRAKVWEQAIALGATHRELADAAGLHHSAIAKALERYGSNGS